MTTWYTSDWHFGHTNVLGFGPGRPFATIEAHDAALIARHNAIVHPDDDVLVLGDVALGDIEASLACCAAMNGRLCLLWRRSGNGAPSQQFALRWHHGHSQRVAMGSNSRPQYSQIIPVALPALRYPPYAARSPLPGDGHRYTSGQSRGGVFLRGGG